MPARLALLLLALVMGCDAVSPAEPVPPFALAPPVIPGVTLISEEGVPLGTYGSPVQPPPVPVSEINCSSSPSGSGGTGTVMPPSLLLERVFPNPSRGATSATYILPCRADAELWIVRGIRQGEQAELNSRSGAVVVSPSLSRLIWHEQGAEPGYHRGTIDADALQLPDGFYRLYLRFGGALTWTDLWINRSYPHQ